jgi:hypothetical protein
MQSASLNVPLLGPTLVASAVTLLVNLDKSQTLIEELSQSPAVIMIAGYAAFVPGLAIVYFHNKWTAGWPVVKATSAGVSGDLRGHPPRMFARQTGS